MLGGDFAPAEVPRQTVRLEVIRFLVRHPQSDDYGKAQRVRCLSRGGENAGRHASGVLRRNIARVGFHLHRCKQCLRRADIGISGVASIEGHQCVRFEQVRRRGRRAKALQRSIPVQKSAAITSDAARPTPSGATLIRRLKM